MLWDCENPGCGCKGIAATLTVCPMCEKEPYMPKATSGGASNAAAGPGEPGYVPPAAPEVPDAAPAELAEHPGTGVEMTGVEHPADGTMSPPISNDLEHVKPPSTAAPKAAWVDHVAQVAGVDPGEAQAMTKTQLQEIADQAAAEKPAQGLPTGVQVTATAEVSRAEPTP